MLNRHFGTTKWLKTALAGLSIWITGCPQSPAQQGEFTQAQFEEMAASMSSKYVANILPAEIPASAVLLDTREQHEYQISHLAGARCVGYDDFKLTNVPDDVDIMDTIIVYCSVGYRSGKIGEQLQKAGYKNVYNLDGGLFRWANEGRQLKNEQNQITARVHGYNAQWAKWLHKDIPVAY